MAILSGIFAFFKSIPVIFDILNQIRKAWAQYQESLHEDALVKLKNAKTEEEQKEAMRELARRP